jgi:hypothetical protein
MKKYFSTILISTSFLLCSYSQAPNQLNFDGVDDYANLNSVSPSMVGSTNYTIEFWMSTDGSTISGNFRSLFAINDASPGDNKLIILISGQSYATPNRLLIYDDAGGSGTIEVVSDSSINDGNCHHIAYVRNGSVGTVYLDGNLAGTHTPNNILTANNRYSLAQEWDNTNTSDHFRGTIDDVRMWNVSRTQLQIQSNMNTEVTGSESGLIAYYNFNQGISSGNNTGLTTSNDLSSNNYDGTLVNMTLNGSTSNWISQECLNGLTQITSDNQLHFDGTNDYVNLNSISPLLVGSTNYTIEFWMKTDGSPISGNFSTLFAINDALPGDNKLMLMVGGQLFATPDRLLVYDDAGGSGNFEITSTSSINDGKCHHIAYVRNGSTGTAYIDGVLIGTHTPNNILTANNRYSLGQEWDLTVTSDHYTGKIDEVRIWNTSRTITDIQSNIGNELTGTETGLIGYYNLNQGIPSGSNPGLTTAIDLTSGSYNGTLVNFGLTGATSNWVLSDCKEQIGIELEELMDHFKLYPNPTNGLVNIETDLPISGQLQVADMCGRIIYHSMFNESDLIDFTSYSKGIYNIVILTEGKIVNFRLIKN